MAMTFWVFEELAGRRFELFENDLFDDFVTC